MGTVRQRRFRSGVLAASLLLISACGSRSESETDPSSGSAATVAVTAANGSDGTGSSNGTDGTDGTDGADGVGTDGVGGAGGGSSGSGDGGEDPDEGPGRPPSPLYIEAIQAFGGPPSGFVTEMESNCEEAKAGPTCTTLTFDPAEKAGEESCSVSRTDPDVREKKIAVGTKLTVHLRCPE